MADERKIVEHYCDRCERDVTCSLLVWIEEVSVLEHFSRDTTSVKIGVSAECPYCSTVLGRGEVFVELH